MTPTLRLYNTLTRSKDVFVPIDPKNVRLYVCGPTVYDYAHIGNARPVIVFDLLFRLLRHVYGADAVTYARNFTDVDDKINARAYERGISIRELTEETARQYEADVRALGVLMPEDVNKPGQPPRLVTPRATDHIDEMRTIIERLVERGAAYVAEDHVLFSVAGMGRLNGVPKYGAFSKRSLDDLLAGARVDVAPYKRDSMDFVLWKPSGPQDPHWPSPAGIATPGRPGWHIECSAMAWRHLVKAFETRLSADDPASRQIFDIHGGGIDLVFPHHENEIAQTCCAFDVPRMANVWMHNGFLQVEGEKMSKSLGNFVTISELLRGWRGQPWSGAAIRWAMLQTHYRQPIDWTFDNLLAARNELWRIFLFARRFDWEANDRGEHFLEIVAKEKHPSDHVLAALADDLNTPEAIARIRESAPKSEDRDAVFQIIRDLMFLGVVSEPTRYLFSTTSTGSNVPAQLTSELAGLALDLRVARANQDVELAVEIHSRAKRLGAKLDERGPWSIDVAFVGTASGQPSIDDLIAARAEARAAKNWAESDRIRDELARLGVVLKDNKDGTTTWEVAR